MKRFLLAATLLLCIASPAVAASEKSSEVLWRSWDPGLREAESTKRPVLVDVYTDWCGWCKRMDADVYSRPDVREYLSKNFVTIKLNAESTKPATYQGKSHTGRSLSSGFGVTGYPTTVFLGSDGERLVNVPGYIKGDRFLLLLRYIGEGYLERGVDFAEFEKSAAPPAKKTP